MVSRVARSPIDIPSGVEVTLADASVSVKGKLGQLSQKIHPSVKVVQVENQLQFAAVDTEQKSDALAGTMRALVNNIVHGVSQGFEIKLVMIGVGYRAKVQGKMLDLTVGLSHPVVMEMPEGVTVETPTQTEIVLKSADKQLVGQIAANIRAIRPPEPYKGKGIRYADEHVSLKETKKK